MRLKNHPNDQPPHNSQPQLHNKIQNIWFVFGFKSWRNCSVGILEFVDGFVLGLSQGETVELGVCGWVSRSSALPLPPPVIRGPGSLRC